MSVSAKLDNKNERAAKRPKKAKHLNWDAYMQQQDVKPNPALRYDMPVCPLLAYMNCLYYLEPAPGWAG